METQWVTGIPKEFGGSGDPSPYTAHGVLMGMKAAAKEKFGTESLSGKKVAVQGLGNVGSNLVGYLIKEGAIVTVADIDEEKVKKTSGQHKLVTSTPEQIPFVDCDIFSPCALGAVINDTTIGKIKAKVICGGANNQLAEARHGDQLQELGILYAPDYVVNAGGLMNVFVELEGYSPDRAFDKTRKVYDNVAKVIEIAKRDKIGTHKAADRLAEERILQIGTLRQRHAGKSDRTFTTLKEVKNR